MVIFAVVSKGIYSISSERIKKIGKLAAHYDTAQPVTKTN